MYSGQVTIRLMGNEPILARSIEAEALKNRYPFMLQYIDTLTQQLC